MRRRTFLTASGASMVWLAGCGLDGTNDIPETLQWETTTEGDADATVTDDGAIELRVFKCSTAEARANLTEIQGTLEMSFDYTFEAEQWWEVPVVVVSNDDEEIYRSRNDDDAGIETTRAGTTSGTFQADVPVDGDVDFVVRIEPSDPCGNSDHGDTFLDVENVALELV